MKEGPELEGREKSGEGKNQTKNAGKGINESQLFMKLVSVCNNKIHLRASLAIQWLTIHLAMQIAMQRTPVRSLAQEDSTCRRATKPVPHNY